MEERTKGNGGSEGREKYVYIFFFGILLHLHIIDEAIGKNSICVVNAIFNEECLNREKLVKRYLLEM